MVECEHCIVKDMLALFEECADESFMAWKESKNYCLCVCGLPDDKTKEIADGIVDTLKKYPQVVYLLIRYHAELKDNWWLNSNHTPLLGDDLFDAALID
jgi:hypothetical protein